MADNRREGASALHGLLFNFLLTDILKQHILVLQLIIKKIEYKHELMLLQIS
jgi:hypothetical protein